MTRDFGDACLGGLELGPATAPLKHAADGRVRVGLAVALGALLSIGSPASAAGDPDRGKALFARQCAFCHGEDGAGDGPDASKFFWAPANLRNGLFKFRSTRSGSPPTDADLLRTLKRGLPGTAMLAQDHLTDVQLGDLIAFLKTLSPKWKEGPGMVFRIERPAEFDRLGSQGREMYAKAGCAQCHGGSGRGGGPSTANLTQNGRPTRPADLSRRPFKGGHTPEDIYRTLAGGLDGTAMPSFLDALDPIQIWTLVAQVQAFEKKHAPPLVSEDETLARELVKQKQPGRK